MKLRLFVAGTSPQSVAAVANLREILIDHPEAEVEIVDVLTDPGLALGEGVFVTPTLVRLLPLPVRKIFGSLDHRERVRLALALDAI